MFFLVDSVKALKLILKKCYVVVLLDKWLVGTVSRDPLGSRQNKELKAIPSLCLSPQTQ